MNRADDEKQQGMKFLKLIVGLGGGYEMLMGLTVFFFIGPLFALLGGEEEITYHIFVHSMAVLAFCFGLLMILAAKDPQRYIMVPLVSILLRLLIQIPVILGCLETPIMTLPLIGFGGIDLVLAVLTIIAIRRSGVDWKKI